MNTSSLHEWVELAKGLAWPVVAVYIATRYAREIRAVLTALGAAVGRMKGAKGFGIEVELLAETAKRTSIEGEERQADKVLPEIKPPEISKGATQ